MSSHLRPHPEMHFCYRHRCEVEDTFLLSPPFPYLPRVIIIFPELSSYPRAKISTVKTYMLQLKITAEQRLKSVLHGCYCQGDGSDKKTLSPPQHCPANTQVFKSAEVNISPTWEDQKDCNSTMRCSLKNSAMKKSRKKKFHLIRRYLNGQGKKRGAKQHMGGRERMCN